jgi:hypothetical protein
MESSKGPGLNPSMLNLHDLQYSFPHDLIPWPWTTDRWMWVLAHEAR